MTEGGGKVPRWLKWVGQLLRHPVQAASLYIGLRDWPQRTVIALVIRTENNSITLLTVGGQVKARQRTGEVSFAG